MELVDPGPIDGSVLHLQSTHRSNRIWEGQEPGYFHCRRSDSLLRRAGPIDDRIEDYLRLTGFYGIYRVGFIQLDWALITALVERWRVETHTFHLPVGECTITLQDVSILLGLPIDGEPVTGYDVSPAVNVCQQLCLDLLGILPSESDLDGSRLKMRWILNHFAELTADADDVTIRRHARAHILQLIGGSLFADKSGNKVKLMYLPLLRQLEDAGKFSWGSAVLACLYREMCRATKPTASAIGGPLILLQLWAWERLIHIRPERQVLRENVDGDEPLPLGYKWRTALCVRETPIHVLRHYRDQLDQMRDYQMVWQPYTDDVVTSLPAYCLLGNDIWRTVSPLICFDVVEWHFPNRVMRQFGLRQDIPLSQDTGRDLHATDRRGRAVTDWAHVHRSYIDIWSQRRDHIAYASPLYHSLDYTDPYMVWYRRITRRFIGPPGTRPSVGFEPVGSIFEILSSSLSQIHIRAGEGRADLNCSNQAFADIQTLSYSALEAIHSQQRVRDEHISGDPMPSQSVPVPQEQGHGIMTYERRRRSAGTSVSDAPPPSSIASPSAYTTHAHGSTPLDTVPQCISPIHYPLQNAMHTEAMEIGGMGDDTGIEGLTMAHDDGDDVGGIGEDIEWGFHPDAIRRGTRTHRTRRRFEVGGPSQVTQVEQQLERPRRRPVRQRRQPGCGT